MDDLEAQLRDRLHEIGQAGVEACDDDHDADAHDHQVTAVLGVVRRWLRLNACTCDPAYTQRDLVAPDCIGHQAAYLL